MSEPVPVVAVRRSGRSVRGRLLAIALLPTLVILPLLLAITMYRWNGRFDDLLIAKVNGDLTIAHQYFYRILDNTEQQIQALGNSARFRDVLDASDPSRLSTFLEATRGSLGLDFLMLVGPDRHIVAAAPRLPSDLKGLPVIDWPVVSSALSGSAAAAVDVLTGAELGKIAPALAMRARIELIPTSKAGPTEGEVETRGMVIDTASPVQIAQRRGVLVGGILLNHNLVFIDTINDLVYRKASLPEGSQGTATLFLDDVRISTNVRLFEGDRALGTRVSQAVRRAVLDQGRTWLDRAYVVNDWYVSGYEPIVDSFGKRIGMLYVGFLDAPFARAKYETVWAVGLAFLGVAALTVPIFLRWARGIFGPLEQVVDTIGQVERGDLGARTGVASTRDEIGRVAGHLDGLLDQLQERDGELRRWNDELNQRVAARTAELESTHRQLEATMRQLIVTEKLAAIGEITAGVAHEINNPIAVLQGNLEVIRQVLKGRSDEVAVELQLIDEQIGRISHIVTRLLQFAKPEEYAGYVERHLPGAVVTDCLPLVRHLLDKGDILLRLEDRATRAVLMNRTELQQVLVNLIVNAIHAMPAGGTLTLCTGDQDREGRPGVAVMVADTGVGIPAGMLGRIFDPFFTTKGERGTGLGLSISQSLVSRQGGTLAVRSSPGEGTTFTVWLPEAD